MLRPKSADCIIIAASHTNNCGDMVIVVTLLITSKPVTLLCTLQPIDR
jgi:hypothetical protein